MKLTKSLVAVGAFAVGSLVSVAATAAVVTIGTLNGSGTVVVSDANQSVPLSWSFNTAFSFDNTPLAALGGFSLKQIMNDNFSQYQFLAASAGTMAVDGAGFGNPTINKGLQQWQILNATVGAPNSTAYGTPFTFGFTPDSVNSPTGAMNGTLLSDGFWHWYGAYDNQAGGQTALTNPSFDFTGRYTLTNFSVNQANGQRTLSVNLTGTITQDIPEPGSLALAGLALAGLGAASRRRKA